MGQGEEENISKDLTEKINSIDKTELDYSVSSAKVQEFNANNRTVYDDLKQKREEYQESLTESKVKIASTEEKINSLKATIESNTQEIATLKHSIERLNIEISSQEKLSAEAMNMNRSKDDVYETEKLTNELKELNNKTNKTYGKKRNDCKADC